MTRKNRLTARHKRALGRILSQPVPEYTTVVKSDRDDASKLRAALTRFEKKHGVDSLISILKLELIERGEERWRLDQMAPHPGSGGQTSLLDAGR